MTRTKALLKEWAPPALLRSLRRVRRGREFSGDYATWDAARRESSGYDQQEILDRVLEAARTVRDGRAAFERDAVTFDVLEPNHALLRTLLLCAAKLGGGLDVVDFGGALGSAWWQHRTWLMQLPKIRWQVVEQESFVAAGAREFSDGVLQFHGKLGDCGDSLDQVLLLSSVLPYLPDPYALLAEAEARRYRWIVVDRTGFVSGPADRLTVQRVPPSIYAASYPCWFLSRDRVIDRFARSYQIVEEWETVDCADIDSSYRGFVFERTS